MVVTVLRLRVCAGRPRVGSPCPWPVGPGVGVHLVKLGSMGRVVLWCLLCCLSSLYSSSRACMCRAVLRNVCRICFALSLPWFGSAVSVSGWGPIPPRWWSVFGITHPTHGGDVSPCPTCGRCYFLRHSGQTTAPRILRRSGHTSAPIVYGGVFRSWQARQVRSCGCILKPQSAQLLAMIICLSPRCTAHW